MEVMWVIPPVIRQEVRSAAESLQMKKETLQEHEITELRFGRQVNDTTEVSCMTLHPCKLSYIGNGMLGACQR